MKLIVGLGNPGKDYENTRHNIGFMVLNYFLGNNVWKEKFNGLYYETYYNETKVIFLKPLTFMNLSGECVKKFIDFFKIDLKDILIIQDDLDLPYLNFRLKYNSSSGGHNGINSIIENLKSNCIPRLKIGIAHDRSYDTKDYVLGRFSQNDLILFNDKADIYKNIIEDFILNDIDHCMMKYNKKGK